LDDTEEIAKKGASTSARNLQSLKARKFFKMSFFKLFSQKICCKKRDKRALEKFDKANQKLKHYLHMDTYLLMMKMV
jgi:hypothetical protein